MGTFTSLMDGVEGADNVVQNDTEVDDGLSLAALGLWSTNTFNTNRFQYSVKSAKNLFKRNIINA